VTIHGLFCLVSFSQLIAMAYKKKRTIKRKAPLRKKRLAKAPTTAMKRYVKTQIARNIENKTGTVYNLGKLIYPTTHANFTSSIFPLSPSAVSVGINQGAAQGQRIGNKIKMKKCTFRGTLHPNLYNATTNPQPVPLQVVMWFFYDKENPQTVPAPLTDFFQFGGTVSAMQNDLVDLWAPINTDKYRVLGKRMFKLGNSEWTTTGSTPSAGNFTNNDFKYNQSFSINVMKWMPKEFVFRDNNSDPTTRGLYCMIQCISASGSQLGAAIEPATLSYISDMEWEDA
jgi:hypothetical protein